MQLRTPNGFFGLMSLALAAFGFWSFAMSVKPIPSTFQTASGPIEAAKAHKRRGNISNIRFSLRGDPAEFSYSSVLPGASDVWDNIRIGSVASVEFTGTASKPLLWGLTLDGQSWIRPDQAYRARRQNGHWALALGIVFTLSGSYLLAKGGRNAA